MSMKKIALTLASIGAAALLVTGASFALFTATTTNADNVFATGTVTINNLTGCSNTFNNIAPGDSGNFDCQVTYTGSLNAWLGLTTSYTGTLTNCDGANSLQATITEASTPSAFGNNAGNQVVGTAPVVGGTTKTFHVVWNLPLSAGNTCQATNATLSLTVKAVQSKNNTLPGPAVGPISWT